MAFCRQSVPYVTENAIATECYVESVRDTVCFRSLSFQEWYELGNDHRAAEVTAAAAGIVQYVPPLDLMARTVAVCVGNADGSRVFCDNDLDAIKALPHRAVYDLFRLAARYCLNPDGGNEKKE
jgi:hypothetical protein